MKPAISMTATLCGAKSRFAFGIVLLAVQSKRSLVQRWQPAAQTASCTRSKGISVLFPIPAGQGCHLRPPVTVIMAVTAIARQADLHRILRVIWLPV
jgi:hypothetical protein